MHHVREQIERLGDLLVDIRIGCDAQDFDVERPQDRQRLTPGQLVQLQDMRQHGDAKHMRLDLVSLWTLFLVAPGHGDADLHRTFVSMVERGERNVTIATVAKLAKALKCRMADLMPDAD